jgi:hypothetical protein
MSAFIAAMDLVDSRTVTSNGDACLKETSSGLLDLFFKLVRGLDAEACTSAADLYMYGERRRQGGGDSA